jgi:hypothetical protein
MNKSFDSLELWQTAVAQGSRRNLERVEQATEGQEDFVYAVVFFYVLAV